MVLPVVVTLKMVAGRSARKGWSIATVAASTTGVSPPLENKGWAVSGDASGVGKSHRCRGKS